MNAPEVLEAVKNVGGSLALSGTRIRYEIPNSAIWLLTELKQNREKLVELLKECEALPDLPAAVRLVKWEPKTPPVAIVRMGIVSDVERFIAATLRELRARLDGKDFLAGNWSLRELVDRLEQVGVLVQVETRSSDGRDK